MPKNTDVPRAEWALGMWPDGPIETAGKPVTTCPRCGAMSSGGHVCKPRRSQ